jgi:hypothetical protein
MKLSQDAKQQRVSYPTALPWWQAERTPGYQVATGTMIVTDPEAIAVRPYKVALREKFSQTFLIPTLQERETMTVLQEE